MKSVVADVTAFHRACDVPILPKPAWPDYDRVVLRMKLIREEQFEFLKAVAHKDMAATADGIADLIYVLVGTALEFGIPLAEVWDEVHAANMRKIDPVTGQVKRREDDKILKPEGWEPPDIAAIIERASP